MAICKIAALGQVFTPAWVVEEMLGLRQNGGRALEPSCGDGAFLARLGRGAVGVEIDAALALSARNNLQRNIERGDFFAHPVSQKYRTIIGNPPYVRHRDILPNTRALLPMARFDGRSNLYLFFIDKCIDHLQHGGELIFITPRDFIKATSGRLLNERLFEEGSFSYWRELGDAAVFAGFSPNCAIWRWQKGLRERRTAQGEVFCLRRGQIWFGDGADAVGGAGGEMGALGDFFDVRVGAVSGADHIFANARCGNVEMVCSSTARDGKTRRMIYNLRHRALARHKAELLARRVRAFGEDNWWEWGRKYHDSDRPRVYVNCKTRSPRPFFAREAGAYDGSVLALIPKDAQLDVWRAAEKLNRVDWQKLGFSIDGRLVFSQRSLMNAPAVE